MIKMNKEKKGFQFAIVDYKVIENNKLNSHDKAVYLVLCRFADTDTGECYPNRKTIAKNAGTSIRQVSNSIKILKNKGYINVKKWSEDTRKNIYTVCYIRDKDFDKYKKGE